MRFSMIVSGMLGLACVMGGVGAGEAPTTPEQIATWVKQLGSDDFDAREKAETELAKAGTAALAELQKVAQSNDPEIRTRSGRLLEILKWATLPKIADLPSVLPPNNILYIGTPSMKAALTRIRKETALGRLYDSAGLMPLRDTLWETGLKDAGWDDDGRKLADQWLDRFGGPYGVAFIRIDETKAYPDREQFALFLGITGANPKAEMDVFRARFPLGGGNAASQVYRGVSCDFLEQDWQKDGLALIQNLIVRSNSKAPMFNVIDAAIDDKQPNLAGAATYKEARGRVSGEPLATLFFNMQALAEGAFKNGRDQTMAGGLGFLEWKYAIVTLGVQDGLISEQAFCKLEGQRRGLGQLLSLEPVSGRLAALCPPDALLFVSIPGDGKAISDGILTMVETVDPNEGRQFRAQMEAMDQQLNIRVMDTLFGGLKGEAALWLLRPQGPNPMQPPGACAVFETVDAAVAGKAVEALAKVVLQLYGKEDAVASAEYQGRKCFFDKIRADGPDKDSFCLSWCADGARILMASSQETLQRMILRATQGTQGLDAKPDFQKLLAAIPQDERGGLLYVNSADALAWGYAVGLPALSADAPEDVKAKLAQMPKDPQTLLKDFPGTLLSVRGQPEGVRARAVGGLPATSFVMAVPFGIFWGVSRAMERAAVMQAVPAPAVEVKVEKEDVKVEKKAEPAKK